MAIKKDKYETLQSLIDDAESVAKYLCEDSVGYHYFLMLQCLKDIEKQNKLEFSTSTNKCGIIFNVRKKSVIQFKQKSE